MAAVVHKQLTDAELNELHSNCIQMSNENKINPRNSWLLPLIDYIDLVMEQQCGGATTNFQVASVTLDASVKIYGNRVDSVHGMAYQVLGGLSRTADTPDDYDNDVEQEGDDDGAQDAAPVKERRHAHHTASTLESNPKNLNIRKFDLEFDVDPLFRKMAATMDEGGARGLLLNQLCVQAGGHLVFDSADSLTAHATVAPAPAMGLVVLEESIHNGSTTTGTTTGSASGAALQELASVEVTTSFNERFDAEFAVNSFTAESAAATDASSVAAAVTADGAATDAVYSAESQDDMPMNAPGFHDNFSDDDDMPVADYGDIGDIDMDNDADMQDALPRRVSMAAVGGVTIITQDTTAADGATTGGRNSSGAAAASRRRSVAGGTQFELALDVENEYGYFASEKLSSWAGPSHWKFRKGATANSNPADDKPVRKAKSSSFKIDFTQKVDKAVVFKRSSRASKSMPVNEELLTLPRDVHFRAASLRKLFYRPNYTTARAFAQRQTSSDVLIRPQRVLAEYQSQEPLSRLLLQRSADLTGASGADIDSDCDDDEGEAAGMDAGGWDDDEAPGGYHNDDNGYDNDDNTGDDGQDNALNDRTNTPLPDGALQMVVAPKKVQKIHIGYAKVAKKVDVHHLKNGLWTQMQQLTGGSKRPTTFSKLVARTPQAAAEDELPDVSVAFCFICMLHLANEHSLTLTSNAGMTEVVIDPTADA
eukprot:TRINITY_DN1089_c0_g1_i1.p1 TRINITY_DN1089_c0_g1~~TRINITY_DN1089_c0_g1_i1.p1  ORF type:complete len:708 (+),score=218.78 TRINITY_DN1089_c0_g1_i1:108-2231(+)